MTVKGPFADNAMQNPREALRAVEGVVLPIWYEERMPIVAAATANDFDNLIFPAKTVIHAVMVDVLTQEATGATKTVDIGISGGDEDGLVDGLSVAAAGLIGCVLTHNAKTVGALLVDDEDGAGALVNQPGGYITTAETTLCYTLGSNDFAELVANVRVLASVPKQ